MAKLRERLPKTERFGDAETRLLQNRHAALKHKLSKTDQAIPWPAFKDFFEAVMSVAPADYLPSKYHLNWGENGNDYRLESLRFKRLVNATPDNLAAELATLLTGLESQEEEPVQLADLVNTAAAHAAA